MEELIKQAPENITYNELEIIFLRNNKNIVDTLTEVWNIPVNNVNNSYNSDNSDNSYNSDNNGNKDKWKTIRETYDEIDKEMYNVIKNSKK
jgi:hypothetical protein